MTSKRTTTFAMTNNERVAHRRKLRCIRQKRWRDKRKDAVRLVPPENLPLYTGHRLGQLVHSFSGEKAKARKRRTKQYKKILKNPRLLAEEKHKASWRARVHRAYRWVLIVGKRKKLINIGFFWAPRLSQNNWNRNWTGEHLNLRSVTRGEHIFFNALL